MKLRAWRAKHDLKAIDAAARLGLDQGFLSKLEAQKKGVTASLGMLLQIEQKSGGEVRAEDVPMTRRTRQQLRELRAREAASPATATAESAA